MKNFKKIISLSFLLMILITSTIPAYAGPSFIQSERIKVGDSTFTQFIDGGSELIYRISGDDTFDKAELAVRIWYKDPMSSSTYVGEKHFGNQTFRNSSYCDYDDKGQYASINWIYNIIKVKAWCRITKNGVSEENIIEFTFD